MIPEQDDVLCCPLPLLMVPVVLRVLFLSPVLLCQGLVFCLNFYMGAEILPHSLLFMTDEFRHFISAYKHNFPPIRSILNV